MATTAVSNRTIATTQTAARKGASLLALGIAAFCALAALSAAQAATISGDNYINNPDTVTIRDADLSAGTGTYSWTDPSGGKGGGYLTIDGTINNVTLEGLTVSGKSQTYDHNNSTADGNIWGPLYVRGDQLIGSGNATLIANDISLTGNTTQMNIHDDLGYSSGFGGAGRLVNLKSLTLNGGAVTGNHLQVAANVSGGASAHANGGGLAIESEWTSTTVLDGMNFSANNVVISGSTAGAASAARGGALYLASTNDELDGTSDPREGMRVYVTSTGGNTVFSNNVARNASGTGGLAGGGAIDAEFAVTLSVDGASFTNNQAIAHGAGGSAQGGAVRLNLSNYYTGGNEADGVLKSIATDTLSFGSLSKTFEYFAAFAESDFDTNKADGDNAQGGALWTNKAVVSSQAGYSTNSATGRLTAMGGAIYSSDTDADGGVMISGGAFAANDATSSNGNAAGGAVWAAGNVYAVGSATFSGNTASAYFGATGGAIYSEGDVYSSSVFTGNSAVGTDTNTRAGAVYAAGRLHDISSQFTGNFAQDSGTTGALVTGGAAYAGAGVDLSGSKFTANYAQSADTALGGAVYAAGAAGNIAGATFDRNYAEGDISAQGGAVWTNQDLTIADSNFTGNYAQSDTPGTALGGAIYVDAGKDLSLSGTTFRGNKTTDGTNDTTNAIYLTGGDVTFTDAANSASYDYDGIAGTGDVTMTGAGSLYLYGNYADLTGDFNLDAGTTYFNGESVINGDINVLAGATLNLENNSSGNSFTVNGTLDMAAGSTLALKVGDDNLYSGGYAAVKATTATIATTDIKISGAIQSGNEYWLVEAVTYNDTAGLDGTRVDNLMMSYSYRVENNEDLVIAVDSVTGLNSIAGTRNQSSFGEYLQNNSNNDLYYYIYNDAGSYEDVLRAMDTSSGDVHASAGATIVQHERRGSVQLLDRMNSVFRLGQANLLASAASGSAYGSMNDCPADPSGIWAEAEGFHYRTDASAESGQGRTKGWGLSLGVDKMVGDWIFGLAFRYGDSRLDVRERNARVDIDSYSLGLYGGRRACVGPAVWHLMGGLTGGYHDLDGKRTAVLGGTRSTYTSDYHAKTLSANLETGLTFGDASSVTFQPFVAGMWNGYWNNSFKERGGNPSLRLDSKSGSDDWFSTTAGVRMAAALGDAATLDVNASWRHTYGNLEPSNRMRFASASSGDRYTVLGTPLDRNEGIFGAGVTVRLGENAQLRAAYDYTLGSGKANSHEGRITIGFSF